MTRQREGAGPLDNRANAPLKHNPRILQIGTIDSGGGAAAVASGLSRAYRARGSRTWLVVGRKQGADPAVLVIRENRRPFYRAIGYSAVQVRLRRLAGRYPDRGFGLVGRTLRFATHPAAFLGHLRGLEDFEFPGSYEVLDMVDRAPDIVQCHNLHGGYFDLRALEWLSQRVPTVLTLHDMWLLTGHCAHALGCERWRTGCGQCPDLRLDPAVRADATAENWLRKRDIYARSRLYVATPSQWLMDRVLQSTLAASIVEARVIPNGVDLSVFHPADRAAVRASLGIPADTPVVLLTTGSLGSMWKDDATLIRTITRVAESTTGPQPLFIALGRETAIPKEGKALVRPVPFQTDAAVIASYYQAADLYLHAARADTAPLAVLEAMACATPVVATAVGGIVEQITGADVAAIEAGAALGPATGVLVPPHDAVAMSRAVVALLERPDARRTLGEQAVADVRLRFSLERQADAYLAWYREILSRRDTA